MAEATRSMSATRFQAYQLEAIADGPSKRVECLCSWHDNLLVGLQDGSTLFYRQVLDPGQGEWRWQVRDHDALLCHAWQADYPCVPRL